MRLARNGFSGAGTVYPRQILAINLERETGLEPAASSLGSLHSTN
jgi:hypothetical protein